MRCETILRDGRALGDLNSGGYGYTVGKGISYGFIHDEGGAIDDFLASGRYELVVANDRFPARIALTPGLRPGWRPGAILIAGRTEDSSARPRRYVLPDKNRPAPPGVLQPSL